MERKGLTYTILGSAAALLLLAAIALPGRRAVQPPDPPQPPTPPQVVKQPQGGRPQVDVVFVLDTTGSMSGLLDGAKRKIWELARFIAQGQPSPDLRVGLIGYRDLDDEYVTKVYDLSDDLDAVYQNLSGFTAGGGGDTPEHVARALSQAVHKVSWSRSKNTLRLIYLVGDAPPHTDYKDEPSYQQAAQQAGEQGIRINTIRCGLDRDTERTWKEIAARAGGEFSTIDQSGGVVDVNTPFDDELAQLNGRLSGTTLGYGSADRRATVAAKARAASAAPAAVQAERAGFFGFNLRKGKAEAVSGEGDLVNDWSNKKVKLDSVDSAALPEPMQAMAPEERERYVADKARERTELLKKISEVSSRRDAYLKARKPAEAEAGFDGQVRRALRKQAKDVGLVY